MQKVQYRRPTKIRRHRKEIARVTCRQVYVHPCISVCILSDVELLRNPPNAFGNKPQEWAGTTYPYVLTVGTL